MATFLFVFVSVAVAIVLKVVGLWDWADPILTLALLGLSIATWHQTRKAREAVYSRKGSGDWVIGLQIGRPVSEAIRAQFGRLDVLVDVKAVIGTDTLGLPDHYEAIARECYRAMVGGAGRSIHLVLSGPVALSFLAGQLAGLHHFNLTVYQFDGSSGKYIPMPRPTRAWLEHRDPVPAASDSPKMEK